MAIPYQCILARNLHAIGPAQWMLFGASGSKLVVQSSANVVTTWPPPSSEDGHRDYEAEERPGKRIKLEHSQERMSNFTNLVLSHDGQYLVGITGEDKTVRVFKIDEQNKLLQLSERCMSRRPCSVVITSDDSTILCADKFGDVYALPLLPSPEDEAAGESKDEHLEPKEKDFVPSATTLTVHSGRNRKTLEEQLKQKAKGILKSKEPMRFKHELLLGHVSMLTDIIFAEAEGRKYIITADRDEHIRISRAQPQAHVIEGFCLGHEAFVSSLCLTKSGKLASGGGDDHVFVWDWQNCYLQKKLPIRDLALEHLKGRPELGAIPQDEAKFKVAVCGIWSVPDSCSDEILVVCEGIPALFRFDIADPNTGHAIALNGNALAVAFVQMLQTSYTAIVSIDSIHKSGSRTEARADQVSRLQCFSINQDGHWKEDAKAPESLTMFKREYGDAIGDSNSQGEGSSTDHKAVQSMLYSIENLRKRPGSEE